MGSFVGMKCDEMWYSRLFHGQLPSDTSGKWTWKIIHRIIVGKSSKWLGHGLQFANCCCYKLPESTPESSLRPRTWGTFCMIFKNDSQDMEWGGRCKRRFNQWILDMNLCQRDIRTWLSMFKYHQQWPMIAENMEASWTGGAPKSSQIWPFHQQALPGSCQGSSSWDMPHTAKKEMDDFIQVVI